MARSHRARQAGKTFGVAEHIGHMAKAAIRIELVSVEAGYANGFLPAMLQGVEPQRGHCGSVLGADYAEHAALFAKLVAVSV
jgi:hypothetical protein